jgi:outer membrane biosynthesis protein TonB
VAPQNVPPPVFAPPVATPGVPPTQRIVTLEPVRPITPPPPPTQLTAAQTRAAAEKAKKAELADAKQKKLQALADKKKAELAAREAAATQAAAEARPAVTLASTNAAPRIAPPPPPAPARASSGGVSQPFSPRPVSGGGPAFPASDDYVGKAGQVTVSCRIQEDGHPAGCNVVAARGGTAFKSSVLKWLNSGRVRYAPILRNGQPVSEVHQWSVEFQGDGQ